MSGPVLETERLVLRPPKPQDFESYLGFITSDRAQYVGRVQTRLAAWKAFAVEAGHWSLHGYGPWVVTLKSTDRSLGQVGVWHPEGFPERELGWLIWAEAEGKGLAYEAAMAARDHDYRVYGTKTLVSYIEPDNARSIRLAERMGAVLDPAAEKADEIDFVYRHPGPEGAR
ncbi:MAG: GNAT family N-acetyltransferase [Pseudomonadota bacterium]